MRLRRPVSPATTFLAVVLFSLVVAGLLVAGPLADENDATGAVPQQLVEPRPEDNVVWPYTSATKSPADPKLALNVVVHGDAERLRWHLTERAGATWNETAPAPEDNESVADMDPPPPDEMDPIVGWSDARGANRYVYVHEYALTEQVNHTTRRPHRAIAVRASEVNASVGGRWISETYQLHDGDYFGSRFHVRAFESPFESDGWVAIQAHSEHWDWFRLRHTVDGIDGAQERLESELMGQWFVEDVWRMYVQNDAGPNSDGWVTVVALQNHTGASSAEAAGLGIGGLLVASVGAVRATRRRRRVSAVTRPPFVGAAATTPESTWVVRLMEAVGRQRFLLGLRLLAYGVLFGSLFGLYLFVRASGIFVEHRVPELSPKLVAGALYLVIAVGLPLCADRFARAIPPTQSFALAAGGFGTAVVVDYSLIEITVLPMSIVLHRIGVAIALGLIAAGASTAAFETPRTNQLSGTGLVLWVVLLVAALLGVL